MLAKETVLLFLVDQLSSQLLMIYKKRGQGAGKWNVPGGKIKRGESAAAAVVRECREETGLQPLDAEACGRLEFHFEAGGSWSNGCTVFRAHTFSGELRADTKECSAHWVPLAEIPWDGMWESDQRWVPAILRGETIARAYYFDKNDHLLREGPLSADDK